MTPEEFAIQLGQIQGTLSQIVEQGKHQIEQNNRLDSKMERVRSELSSKIDTELAKVEARFTALGGKVDLVKTDLVKKVDEEIKAVTDRVNGVDERLQQAEKDAARKNVIVAGGASIMMVAAVEGIRALFKFKGGG